MRALILIAGAALALTACGNNDQVDNTTNLDENLAAENIVSNDVTAIDAVTGEAANMAADMDVNFTNELESVADNTAVSSSPAPRPSGRPKKPSPETPVSNETAVNETVNAAE